MTKKKLMFDGIEFRGTKFELFYTEKFKECSASYVRMPMTCVSFIRFFGWKVLWNKAHRQWANVGIDLQPSLLKKWLQR